jgi:hypothetical protein
MDDRGKQRQVLFDGAQDCAQLFHLPLRVSNAMFDRLDDDDDVLVNVGTPATATNAAIAPEQPEWIANNFDTKEVFDNLAITFVDGAPVAPDQDDKPDTLHVVDETPKVEEEDNNDDGNVYARDFSIPSMEGYPFRQPALDSVFCEMFEKLQMRCLDIRALVDPAFVE